MVTKPCDQSPGIQPPVIQMPPAKPRPKTPMELVSELGSLPATKSAGEIDEALAPNAPAQLKGKIWQPIVVTLAAGDRRDIDIGILPERVHVTLITGSGTVAAGSVIVYPLAAGGGIGLPLSPQSPSLRLPGTGRVISLANAESTSQTVTVIATDGYALNEKLGYD